MKVPDLTKVIDREFVLNKTVEDLKLLVNEHHPYKPSVKCQRMLFAGRQLNNSTPIKEVFDLQIKENTLWNQTKTIHLMIKQNYHVMKEQLENQERGIEINQANVEEVRTTNLRRRRETSQRNWTTKDVVSLKFYFSDTCL